MEVGRNEAPGTDVALFVLVPRASVVGDAATAPRLRQLFWPEFGEYCSVIVVGAEVLPCGARALLL